MFIYFISFASVRVTLSHFGMKYESQNGWRFWRDFWSEQNVPFRWYIDLEIWLKFYSTSGPSCTGIRVIGRHSITGWIASNGHQNQFFK